MLSANGQSDFIDSLRNLVGAESPSCERLNTDRGLSKLALYFDNEVRSHQIGGNILC